jgi:hypothetical protein
MLGILYHVTKIEADSRHSVLSHSAEEKTTRNLVPWNKNRRKLSEFRSEACLRGKYAVYSVCWSRIFSESNFFHAVSFRSEPRNLLFCKPRIASEVGMSAFFRRITEPSPFRVYSAEFFLNEIPLPTLAVTLTPPPPVLLKNKTLYSSIKSNVIRGCCTTAGVRC